LRLKNDGKNKLIARNKYITFADYEV